MDQDEKIKKSYDFASDLSKQMITLSTAIITLCVAFTDKLFSSAAALANSGWLMTSLLVFIISISIGVFHLMGLTGQLGKETSQQEAEITTPTPPASGAPPAQPAQANQSVNSKKIDVSIYSKTNRITSFLQVISFVVGLGLALAYIWLSIPSSSVPVESTEKIDTAKFIKIIRTSDYVIVNGEKTDTLYWIDKK